MLNEIIVCSTWTSQYLWTRETKSVEFWVLKHKLYKINTRLFNHSFYCDRAHKLKKIRCCVSKNISCYLHMIFVSGFCDKTAQLFSTIKHTLCLFTRRNIIKINITSYVSNTFNCCLTSRKTKNLFNIGDYWHCVLDLYKYKFIMLIFYKIAI